MSKFFTVVFLTCFTATLSLAETFVVQLKVPLTETFASSYGTERDVPIGLFVLSSEGIPLVETQLALKPSWGSGALVGNATLDQAPDGAYQICYDILSEELKGKFVIRDICEPIQIGVINNNQYFDSRTLIPPGEYYAQKRIEIQRAIASETSSDSALFKRDEEVSAYFEDVPLGTLDKFDARLIEELVLAARRVGTRLPNTAYFEFGEETGDPVAASIRAMVVRDRGIEGNSNAAKVLFNAYQKVDVAQYAIGRADFAETFFDTFAFLAIERARIARENDVSGSTVAKEFAVYCKSFDNLELSSACSARFQNNLDMLVGEALATGYSGAPSDLMVALKYHLDATTRTKDVAPTIMVDAQVSLLKYRNSICVFVSQCILPKI